MKFIASIKIMPNKNLLDPQGKAVLSGLKNLGINNFNDLRVGKNIDVELESDSLESANNTIETACKSLLANSVMESFVFEVSELS